MSEKNEFIDSPLSKKPKIEENSSALEQSNNEEINQSQISESRQDNDPRVYLKFLDFFSINKKKDSNAPKTDSE